MATYYKYAERNAANQVDWSAIGKSISDTLSDEVKRREQAKKDIEDASNEYAETLANAPMGESRDFNEWTLDFANNAQEFRLMQDRMLRSGRMKLRDYNMGRQNLKSGTEQAFNLANQYNAEYADKMKRLQNGESQDLEGFLMGTAEGFSNFTKSSLYIDPTTGKVAVANKVQKTLPDGTVVYEMSKNPNDFTSINSLRNRITSKYNKFDVSKSLQPGVADLGKRIEVIMKGGVKTREDAKQTPGYTTARDTFIDSFVETNPDNLTSILTDTLTQVVRDGQATGESFEFTFDPEQAKSSDKYILLRENPQTGRVEGDFTTANGKKQKEMAKEFLKTKFDTMVDFEETARQEFAPKVETERSKEQKNIDAQNTTAWGQLYYGTPEQQQQGADRLLASPIARREDLIDIDVRTEPGTVILRYKDSTKDRKIDITDDAGNPIAYSDFMALGNELHGVEDYGKAVQLSGRSDAIYNIDRKGRATRAGKANLYGDPETIVIFKGEKRVPKDIIQEDISNIVDKENVRTIQNVFDVLNLPKPQLKINAGGEEIRPAQYEIIGGQTIRKPSIEKEKSLEMIFPNVPPINIPEGERFQDILDKIIEVLDASFKSNTEVSVEEIKAAFPTPEMFENYNPGFSKETTSEAPKKRSIAQIMKEDGVTQVEAVKIFKAQ
jgi:hypothetical protein